MTKSEVAGMAAASESNGLITRAEARKHLTERQLQRTIEAGGLVEVLPRVYRFLSAPQGWMQSLEAIQLWDKRTVFSHRTAAALHGFELFKEGPIDLTTTNKLRPHEGIGVYRVKVLLRSECTDVNDLRVTKVPRTLIDLMSSTDWYTMKTTIDQVLREKKATLAELEAAAKSAKRRPGSSSSASCSTSSPATTDPRRASSRTSASM